MLARYDSIKSIVIEQDGLSHFKLNQNEISRMLSDIANSILSWKGVDMRLCHKEKQSFRQYKRTRYLFKYLFIHTLSLTYSYNISYILFSTNWYNRNKPKFFGTYFFYPLIFHHILKVYIH